MASGDVSPKILSGSAPNHGIVLDTTETTIVPADSMTFNKKTIKQITICNTSGLERLVTIGVNGVSASNAIMYDLPIAAYDTIVFDTAITLEPFLYLGSTYGFLSGQCDSSGAVTVTAFGWETEA